MRTLNPVHESITQVLRHYHRYVWDDQSNINVLYAEMLSLEDEFMDAQDDLELFEQLCESVRDLWEVMDSSVIVTKTQRRCAQFSKLRTAYLKWECLEVNPKLNRGLCGAIGVEWLRYRNLDHALTMLFKRAEEELCEVFSDPSNGNYTITHINAFTEAVRKAVCTCK